MVAYLLLTVFKCMYFKESSYNLKSTSSIFSSNRIKNGEIEKKFVYFILLPLNNLRKQLLSIPPK